MHVRTLLAGRRLFIANRPSTLGRSAFSDGPIFLKIHLLFLRQNQAICNSDKSQINFALSWIMKIQGLCIFSELSWKTGISAIFRIHACVICSLVHSTTLFFFTAPILPNKKHHPHKCRSQKGRVKKEGESDLPNFGKTRTVIQIFKLCLRDRFCIWTWP